MISAETLMEMTPVPRVEGAVKKITYYDDRMWDEGEDLDDERWARLIAYRLPHHPSVLVRSFDEGFVLADLLAISQEIEAQWRRHFE